MGKDGLQEKKSEKFVNLWLWLMIISNIIIAILQITSAEYAIWKYASEDRAKSFFFVEHSMVDYYIHMAYLTCGLTMVIAVAYILIKKWRKMGFWILLCSSAIYVIIMISFGYIGGWTSRVVISIIGIVLGVFVLWKILQIKKDGVSYWEQLE